MNNNSTIIIICGAILLICCIYLIYKIFWAPQSDEITEVETSDNNPFLKQVSDFRQSCVNNIIGELGAAWLVGPDQLHVKVEMIDWNDNLITIVYENHIIRCYLHWKRGFCKVSYGFENECFRYTKSKIFRIKNNALDYFKFNHWIIKNYIKILLNAWPDVGAQELECCGNARHIVEDESITEDDYQEMLLDIWKAYRIHNNKEEIEADLSNFSKLTAYILKYCPKKLQEFLQEQRKTERKK